MGCAEGSNRLLTRTWDKSEGSHHGSIPRFQYSQLNVCIPHYFRHNYVTLLYESGVDPLIAMKIVGHTDYKTTANIYTHVRDEMLKKATVNMNEVFQKRTEE